MASLLKLPREVRDQIIKESILSLRTAPGLAALINERLPLRNDFHPAQNWVTNVFVERDQKRWLNNALLGTNRQLRAETQAVIQRLNSPPNILDVVFVKNVGLMPTWLSFKLWQKHIDTLHVQFRILDNIGDVDEAFPWFDEAVKWRGDERTSGILNIMVLLSCYIPNILDDPVQNTAGFLPVEVPTSPEGRDTEFEYFEYRTITPYTIKNIIIDIIGPEAETCYEMPRADPGKVNHCKFGEDIFDRDDPWPEHPPRPEGTLQPAHYLGKEIFETLHWMTRWDPFEAYGELWYQNMGDFEVRVNGQYWDKVDGTYEFCNSRSHYPLFYSEEDRAFRDDIDGIMQKVERRRQCGLWNESTFERLWEA